MQAWSFNGFAPKHRLCRQQTKPMPPGMGCMRFQGRGHNADICHKDRNDRMVRKSFHNAPHVFRCSPSARSVCLRLILGKPVPDGPMRCKRHRRTYRGRFAHVQPVFFVACPRPRIFAVAVGCVSTAWKGRKMPQSAQHQVKRSFFSQSTIFRVDGLGNTTLGL